MLSLEVLGLKLHSVDTCVNNNDLYSNFVTSLSYERAYAEARYLRAVKLESISLTLY